MRWIVSSQWRYWIFYRPWITIYLQTLNHYWRVRNKCKFLRDPRQLISFAFHAYETKRRSSRPRLTLLLFFIQTHYIFIFICFSSLRKFAHRKYVSTFFIVMSSLSSFSKVYLWRVRRIFNGFLLRIWFITRFSSPFAEENIFYRNK